MISGDDAGRSLVEDIKERNAVSLDSRDEPLSTRDGCFVIFIAHGSTRRIVPVEDYPRATPSITLFPTNRARNILPSKMDCRNIHTQNRG